MPTYSALTTLSEKDSAEALAEAMENFLPEPTGEHERSLAMNIPCVHVRSVLEENANRVNVAIEAPPVER